MGPLIASNDYQLVHRLVGSSIGSFYGSDFQQYVFNYACNLGICNLGIGSNQWWQITFAIPLAALVRPLHLNCYAALFE